MTCVTAADLHRTIPAVEGQGKSPKQEREARGGGGTAPSLQFPLMDYLKSSFFLKYLAYFMVLECERYNVKSPLGKDGSCSNAMDMSIFLFWKKKEWGGDGFLQGFKTHVIFIFSISQHNSQRGTKVIIARVKLRGSYLLRFNKPTEGGGPARRFRKHSGAKRM